MPKAALPLHNWPVYGHDWAVDRLRRAIVNDRLRHAYLFVGIDAIGKRTLAYSLAMALNAPHTDETANIDLESNTARRVMSGNHPDIVLSQLDEKTGALKIEAVRDVTSKLALRPYEARYRVAILDEFQNARPQAQDALLKTLEEPAETALLVVLARSSDSILSTITSRCQTLSLRPLPVDDVRRILEQQYSVAPPEADLIARVSGGRVGWAIDAAQPDSPALQQRETALNMLEEALRHQRKGRFDIAEGLGRDKQGLFPLLELWMTYWRDVMLVASGTNLPLTNIDREDAVRDLAAALTTDEAAAALSVTRETLTTLQRTNTNPRLAVEVMFLDWPGLRRTT